MTKFLYLMSGTRGQIVIRSGFSSVQYHLFFSKKVDNKHLLHFVGEKSILKLKQVSVVIDPCPDLKALDRGLPGEDKSYLKPDPKNWWNPSKATPVYVFRLAAGEAIFLEDSPPFKKFVLKSKRMKGLFTLRQEDPNSPMYIFSRSAGPGQPIEKRK